MNTFTTQPLHHSTDRKWKRAILAGLLSTVSGVLCAAPGTLSNSPLFLSNKVQPNIFFMVDDSGSMDWEVLLTPGALAAHPNDSDRYATPAGQWSTFDFTPDTATEQRRLCAGYNSLHYDPTRTYTPWRGADSAGNPYQDQPVTSARIDPYNSSAGTMNLSDHYYFIWNDANNDGVYQSGECPTHANDAVDTRSECQSLPDTVCMAVTDLDAAGKTNYANWFSYYRKREFVAKRALSPIIANSDARMGLASLHNNNSVRTLIKDMDDISTPINTTAQANKAALLRNLSRVNSSGGTPLRQSLRDVGEYYAGNSSWGSSPILPASQGGECQQNFAILMSDGYWNGSSPSVGNTDTDGPGPWDGGDYADNYSNTLADVAMHYYETDLSALDNRVPVITGVDENTAQHMVTYTVAFGLKGTLADDEVPGQPNFNGWPQPVADTETALDDMRHAAFNGRGQFLNAENPQDLIDSLNQYIADIQSRTGTAAAVSFNSTSLQTDTKLLKAEFNSDRWSGDLIAYNINNGSLGSIAWRASTDLNARTAASRNIVTFNGSGGVEFSWDSLTSAQQEDLRTDSTGALGSEASGLARLDYIRGQRGCEQNSTGSCSYTDSNSVTFNSKILRQRNSKLGDIIHSSPTYVGPPGTRYPDNIASTPYRDFVNAHSGRTPMTYVGSNDGMLHAFNASGVEVFAYVPSTLFSTSQGAGLHYLTESGYIHRYYVDLSATVADAFVDLDGSGTSSWRSILVGGLRGGGKGLFAIDVTDPSALSSAAGAAGKVLWEFTHDDLGYTFSDVRIGKLNNGKWAAIFGNGYNNDPNGDGSSKVFIVYLDGTNLNSPILLETGAGTIANGDCGDGGSDCNGMSTPAIVDLNGDGAIDRIYAGDVHGKMWSFDIKSSDPDNWQSAYGASPNYTPLFRACSALPCTTANRQPITTKPSVARHPFKRDAATWPNLMVFFGTGQFLTATDNTSSALQTFYGVWDSNSSNLDRSNLVSQTITEATTGGVQVRTISDVAVDYATSKGWKIDLPTSKERSVTSPQAFGQLVFFNTMIPSTGACDDGGYGWLMAVDMLNGGMPGFQPIDVNGDGKFDITDQVGSDYAVGTRTSGIPTESRFISDKRVTANSDGSVNFQNIQHSGSRPAERMSWTGLER
ncbi:MAG: hypothetical protein J5I92_14395 [Thiogranum sp.]|nr:hypothetical protein [Thiogranum sp.]